MDIDVLDELQFLVRNLGPAEFVGSFTSYFDHGLLVVEDSDSQAVHDEWASSEALVNQLPDSLCLRTQVYVDGPVTVFVFREPPSVTGAHLAFSGRMDCPSGSIKVEDSDATVRMTIPVARTNSSVAILVDDLALVECVAVIIGE